MRRVVFALPAFAIALMAVTAWADIFRWDNGQVIPGTEGITPGPGVQLDHRDLAFANLPNADLTGSNFNHSKLASAALDNTRFINATLKGANLERARPTDSDFTNANLAEANLADANFAYSILAGTAFTDAIVTGASFSGTATRGFTKDQLYSTASYRVNGLRRIFMDSNYLSGWDFNSQDLTQAVFTYSDLTDADLTKANLESANLNFSTLKGADFTDAIVKGASFAETTSYGFSKDQLYSTASYRNKDLEGILLPNNNLRGWDFSGQNLTDAYLGQSSLGDVSLVGSTVKGAVFDDTGLSKDQLYSTASYHGKDLRGISLSNNDLSVWDFNGQDLRGANLTMANMTHAYLNGANLTGAVLYNANLSDALIAGALLNGTTSRGFTASQFFSTGNARAKELPDVSLGDNDLNGWNFSGQYLGGSSLAGSTLTDASFVGAVINGTSFEATTSRGFTKDQLASTASYQLRDLRAVRLNDNDLSGWDLTGQDLRDGRLDSSLLTDANLSLTDLRGATTDGALGAARLRNSISPDGSVARLDLKAAEVLVIRDDGIPDPPPESWQSPRPPIPIAIRELFAMSEGSVLELRLDREHWDSVIFFEQGIPVTLGGTLELTFGHDKYVGDQVGHTFDLFDWTGVSPTGVFVVSSLYSWDVSRLYITGEVTLLAAGGVIAGDSNRDGKVDLADFGILKDNFGSKGGRFQGDANGDGHIDLSDFGLLKVNFGKSVPANAAVSEPSTWLLAALAALGCAAMRSCRR